MDGLAELERLSRDTPYPIDVDRALEVFRTWPSAQRYRDMCDGDARFGLWLWTCGNEMERLLGVDGLGSPVQDWRAHFDAGRRPVIAIQLELRKLGIVLEVPPGTVID